MSLPFSVALLISQCSSSFSALLDSTSLPPLSTFLLSSPALAPLLQSWSTWTVEHCLRAAVQQEASARPMRSTSSFKCCVGSPTSTARWVTCVGPPSRGGWGNCPDSHWTPEEALLSQGWDTARFSHLPSSHRIWPYHPAPCHAAPYHIRPLSSYTALCQPRTHHSRCTTSFQIASHTTQYVLNTPRHIVEPLLLLARGVSTPPPCASVHTCVHVCASLFGTQGVVHGDLKAENILLSAPLSSRTPSFCIAKISDFGVSHVFQVPSLRADATHSHAPTSLLHSVPPSKTMRRKKESMEWILR